MAALMVCFDERCSRPTCRWHAPRAPKTTTNGRPGGEPPVAKSKPPGAGTILSGVTIDAIIRDDEASDPCETYWSEFWGHGGDIHQCSAPTLPILLARIDHIADCEKAEPDTGCPCAEEI